MPIAVASHSVSEALMSSQAAVHRSVSTYLRVPVKLSQLTPSPKSATVFPMTLLSVSGEVERFERLESRPSRKVAQSNNSSNSRGHSTVTPHKEQSTVMVHAKAGTGLGLPICKQVRSYIYNA